MDIVPLGPGFGAEMRGVTLADVANDDAVLCRGARRVRATFGSGVPQSTDQRRRPACLFAPLRPAGSHQDRLARHRHPFRDPHHDRRRRQSGAGGSPLCDAQQGQPALAHRQFVQERAGADLGARRAHHSGGGRRNRIRLDAARLRAARCGDCRRNWKIPSPGIITAIRAARSRPVSPPPKSSRRCRRCAGAWCGRIRSTAATRSTSPRTLMRSKAWSRKPARNCIEELTEAATAPGTTYEHKWRDRRRGDVGQPRHHASRPAVARQRAALHGAHHDLGDGGRRRRTDAAAAAARGGVTLFDLP